MNAYLARFLAQPTTAPAIVTVDGERTYTHSGSWVSDADLLDYFGSPELTEAEQTAVADHYAAHRRELDERYWFLRKQLEVTRGPSFWTASKRGE